MRAGFWERKVVWSFKLNRESITDEASGLARFDDTLADFACSADMALGRLIAERFYSGFD